MVVDEENCFHLEVGRLKLTMTFASATFQRPELTLSVLDGNDSAPIRSAIRL